MAQTIQKNQRVQLYNGLINWGIQIFIPNETIFNSFKYSGISKLLDGSEDGKFIGCQDIEKEYEIIQIEIMMSYIEMMIM